MWHKKRTNNCRGNKGTYQDERSVGMLSGITPTISCTYICDQRWKLNATVNICWFIAILNVSARYETYKHKNVLMCRYFIVSKKRCEWINYKLKIKHMLHVSLFTLALMWTKTLLH